jgi:hypothetical protein
MAVFATYAAGLAAVADGGTFEVLTSDSTRARSYVRVSSSIGRYTGTAPAAATKTAADALLAVARANRLPNTPLIDFDPVVGLYGTRELENLVVGSPAPGLNAVAGLTTSDWQTAGNVVVTSGAASSDGCTPTDCSWRSGRLPNLLLATHPPG